MKRMQQLTWTAWFAGVAVLSSAVAVGAATQRAKASPASPGHPSGAAVATQKTPAPKPGAARAEAVTGTIAAYDASGETLTIKTATGDQTVTVGAGTRIREGAKTLKASDLSGLVGRNVKARCRESGGKLMATSIAVAPAGK